MFLLSEGSNSSGTIWQCNIKRRRDKFAKSLQWTESHLHTETETLGSVSHSPGFHPLDISCLSTLMSFLLEALFFFPKDASCNSPDAETRIDC